MTAPPDGPCRCRRPHRLSPGRTWPTSSTRPRCWPCGELTDPPACPTLCCVISTFTARFTVQCQLRRPSTQLPCTAFQGQRRVRRGDPPGDRAAEGATGPAASRAAPAGPGPGRPRRAARQAWRRRGEGSQRRRREEWRDAAETGESSEASG